MCVKESEDKETCKVLASANTEVLAAGEFGNCISLTVPGTTSATELAVLQMPLLPHSNATVGYNLQGGVRPFHTVRLHDYLCMHGMYKHIHSKHSAYCFIVYRSMWPRPFFLGFPHLFLMLLFSMYVRACVCVGGGYGIRVCLWMWRSEVDIRCP